MIPLKYIHNGINIFLLLSNRIDRWCKDKLIVRWREHPLTVRNDELSWSCSLYREGLWHHRVLACMGDAPQWFFVVDISEQNPCTCIVFEKTAYMHILVNNNFIESMEWNTASHCQPNLSTYIVDCFESVSSLYSQLIVHLPVPLTGRIHPVRDCMYYMSDFLHYV